MAVRLQELWSPDMKVVLVGVPISDSPLERHSLPGVVEYVLAEPGTIFFERDLISKQVARARWWRRCPDGGETLLYEVHEATGAGNEK